MSGGEAKSSELLPHEGIPAIESNRTSLGPLNSGAQKPPEKSLRVITQVLNNRTLSLKPAAAATAHMPQAQAAVLQAGGNALKPQGKESPAFDYQNAVTIEDNHG